MIGLPGRPAPAGIAGKAALTAAICALCLSGLAPGVAAADVGGAAADQKLQSRLSDYLSGLDATYGVVAISLEGGRSIFINANAGFPTASMYKLLVMYRVFQAMDRGKLSSSDVVTIQDDDVIQDEPDGGFGPGDTPTVEEALHAMIAISSNAAALALVRELGGPTAITSAAWELGMDSTALAEDSFWSTPGDMALFFQLLANRSLVSPKASEQMIRLLLQQTINDRLPALLPEQAAVAHKTGEMDDVRNDGGIVYGPGGGYVIVLMSRGGTPEEEAEVEARLSYMVYREYGQ